MYHMFLYAFGIDITNCLAEFRGKEYSLSLFRLSLHFTPFQYGTSLPIGLIQYVEFYSILRLECE